MAFRLIIIWVCAVLLAPRPSAAQQPCSDCDCLLRQAETKKNQGDLADAINLYQAYGVCDPTKQDLVAQRIGEIQKETARQRDQAMADRASARRYAKEAEQKKAEAEHQRNEALKSADRVRKAVRINHNTVIALRALNQNPTLAVNIAKTSAQNHRDDAGAQQLLSDLLSNPETYFYRHSTLADGISNNLLVASANEQKIATAGSDQKVRLWTSGGAFIDSSDVMPGFVRGMQFDEKGKRLLVFGLSWAMVLDDSCRVVGSIVGKTQDRGTWAAISPDGTRWANGFQGKVFLWDDHCVLLDSLVTSTERISHLAFSPAGNRLLICTTDTTALIWDFSTPQPVRLGGHIGGVFRGAFHPKGQLALTIDENNEVHVWDAVSGKQLATFVDSTNLLKDRIYMAEFINNDSIFMAVANHTPVIWGWKSAVVPRLYREEEDQYYDSWLTSSALVVVSQNRTPSTDYSPLTLRIFGRDGSYKTRLYLANDLDLHRIREVQVSFGQEIKLFYLPQRQTVDVFTLSNRRNFDFQLNRSVSNFGTGILPFAGFSPDNKIVLQYDLENMAIYSLQGKFERRFPGFKFNEAYLSPYQISVAAAKTPRGIWALAIYGDSLRLWRDSAVVHVGNLDGSTRMAAFSPHAKYLVAANMNSEVWAASLSTDEVQPRRLGMCDAPIRCLAISPSDTLCAAGSMDSKVNVWSMNRQGQFHNLKITLPNDAQPFKIQFTPGGRHICVLSDQGEVSLWDLGQPLKPRRTWRGYRGSKGDQTGWRNMVLSTRGPQMILLNYDDNTPPVLADLDGLITKELRGHQFPVEMAAFSPFGPYLLTAAGNTVRLWDTLGRELMVWRGHQRGVYNMAFSPDSCHVLTVDGRGTARIWDLPAIFLRNKVESFSLNTLVERDFVPEPDTAQLNSLFSSDALERAAYNYFQLRDTLTAHRLYDKLISSTPDLGSEIWYNWYVTTADPREREKNWARLLQQKNLLAIADQFKTAQRYKEARLIYEQLLITDAQTSLSDYFELCSLDSTCQIDVNRFLREENPRKLVNYARFFQAEGDETRALELYRRALNKELTATAVIGLLDLYPENSPEYLQILGKTDSITQPTDIKLLAEYFIKQGEPERACSLYSRLKTREALLARYESCGDFPNYRVNTSDFWTNTTVEDMRSYLDYFYYREDDAITTHLLASLVDSGQYEYYFEMYQRDSLIYPFERLLSLQDVDLLRNLSVQFSSNAPLAGGMKEVDLYRKSAQLGERVVALSDNPDDRYQLAMDYNNVGWRSIFEGRFADAEQAIRAGLLADTSNLYLNTNLPHTLLFQGKFKEARDTYLKYAPDTFGLQGLTTYYDAYLSDFQTFGGAKADGNTHFTDKMIEDMARIKEALDEQHARNAKPQR